MQMARTTRATLVAIAIAAIVFGIAMLAHSRALNDTEIVQVALNPDDPERTRIGQLEYLGGLDIPPMGQNIGGLSGLRWDADTGRLLAITDDARWVWIAPIEEQGRLTGIAGFEIGNLLGPTGETLAGKEHGDSESLMLNTEGDWLVGFERDHRVLRYESLDGPGIETELDPEAEFGALAENGGLEAMAGNALVQLICVEREASPQRPNCLRHTDATGPLGLLAIPPRALVELDAVPTDADVLSDGNLLILFRSYSPAAGNAMAIMSFGLDEEVTELAVIKPPLTVDNFEGLAVREEAGRTFLYIISDDNFSSNQRTLLMKFEVVTEE